MNNQILIRGLFTSQKRRKAVCSGRGIRAMTVCIAALAADSRVIVCVADKAITYGDSIQWDSDWNKMFSINDNAMVMLSGGQHGITKVLGALLTRQEEIGVDSGVTLQLCEKEYQEVLHETIQARFLTPRLLTREEYVAASSVGPLINEHIRVITEEIRQFNMDCQLIVCGFDSSDRPFILDIDHPGEGVSLTTVGFDAIGCGWEKATARMLWSNYERVNPIERVLFDAFDAKASAELTGGVGYAWDAAVMIPRHRPVYLSEEIKDLIERVWDDYTRSPFEKWNPNTDPPPPPKTWKRKLERYFDAVMALVETSGS